MYDDFDMGGGDMDMFDIEYSEWLDSLPPYDPDEEEPDDDEPFDYYDDDEYPF